MGTEWMMYLRAFFSLMFVAGLIVLSAALAKKFNLDRKLAGGKTIAPRTLEVIETLYLDPKHRLVKLRSGDSEHLLLLGTAGDLLVESKQSERRI